MSSFEVSGMDFIDRKGPGRDVILAAAVHERFRPSELIGDWLESHGNDESSRELEEVIDVALSLGAISGEDAEREGGVELPLAVRREILTRTSLSEIKDVLAKTRRKTTTESHFLDILSGRTPEMDVMNRGELLAVAAAASWSENLPAAARIDPAEVRQRIADQDFVERVGGADLHHFVGRKDLLNALRQIWETEKRPVVLIEGPGGIGKSIAVARFFQMLLQEDADIRPDAILHLDFDLPWLQGAKVSDVTIEIVRQLSQRWLPDDRRLRDRLRRFGGASNSRYSDHQSIEFRDYRNTGITSSILEDSIDSLQRSRARRPKLILFVDSFERVELRDEVAAQSINRLAEMLRMTGADLMVIVAARAFANPDRIAWPMHSTRKQVTRFTQRESVDYLVTKARQRGIDLQRGWAARANQSLKGWPLGLRIAVSLLGDNETFDAGDWLDQISGGGRTIQATLYERLLDRIRDKDLRRLAKPGLIVRRITPRVIERVLAEPCGLSSNANATYLMALAEREGQLFWRDGADPDALWHRQDLREIMLPVLRREVSPKLIREIHDAAVDYYARESDDVSRAEELYHRLCRGDARHVIQSRWRPTAGQRLVGALGELPRAAAATVRLLLGGGRSDVATELDELRAVARNRISEGMTDLSDLFEKAGVAFGLLSPLGDVYATSLVAQRRFDELFTGAEKVFAAYWVPKAVRARIALTAASVAEGQMDLDRALSLCRIAQRKSKALNPVEQLSARVAIARLLRKLGRGKQGRHSHVLAATTLLARVAEIVSSNPVAELEVVAELSELLRPTRRWQTRADPDGLRLLPRLFNNLNPMFPSAFDNRQRLEELATLLGLDPSRIRTEDQLARQMLALFGSPLTEQHAQALAALRSEVDASFTLAVSGNNVSRF